MVEQMLGDLAAEHAGRASDENGAHSNAFRREIRLQSKTVAYLNSIIHAMTASQRPAGRPRDGSVDIAVLVATQDLLLEHGFDRVSIDAVAARAGVAKATVYRRWPGKTALVVAAVADLAHVPPVPDTGSLRDDLLACARTYTRNERGRRVMLGLMTAMVHHAELRAAAREALGAPFAALFHTVISRAIERGDASPRSSPTAIGDVFPAMAFHRGAALGLPVDEDFLSGVVDELLLPLLGRDPERR